MSSSANITTSSVESYVYRRKAQVIEAAHGHDILIVRLEIDPKLRSRVERLAKQDSGIGGDGALAIDDCGDAVRRHAEGSRQAICADAERQQELLLEGLPRVNGDLLTCRDGLKPPSVIVRDLKRTARGIHTVEDAVKNSRLAAATSSRTTSPGAYWAGPSRGNVI
jgi:hypothetical protein